MGHDGNRILDLQPGALLDLLFCLAVPVVPFLSRQSDAKRFHRLRLIVFDCRAFDGALRIWAQASNRYARRFYHCTVVVYFGGWFSRCLMRCYSTCGPDAFRLIRLKATRLNRGCIRQAHEKIAGTLTGRAFFIAVIACCLTVCTFVPVGSLGSDCVHAAATLFVTDFGTTTVCDPQVVTSGATVRTTGNR
jgi:hypothetical protein